MGHVHSEAVRSTIFTVGHSTRGIEAFLDLLQAYRIERLADVRTIPRSARHPHFSREPLEASLAARGLAYRHFPALGGLRHPRSDSVNTAWRNSGFRGYADHMASEAFANGVQELLGFAAGGTACVMCAEAVWWRCHRQLLADALVVRGIEVRHILSPTSVKRHVLNEFARELNGRLCYPGVF